jgi:hypothetical protein
MSLNATKQELRAIPFDGKNFILWEFKIKSMLNGADLLFILTDDPNSDDWKPKIKNHARKDEELKVTASRLSSRVASILVLSQSDEVIHVVQNVELGNAKSVWERLQSEYARNTMAARRLARKEFHNTRLRKQGFSKYAETLRTLRTQMSKMGDNIKDDEMAIALLNGLPTEFDTIATIIESQFKDNVGPTYDDMVKIIQDYVHKQGIQVGQRDDDEAKAFQARANSSQEVCRDFNRGRCHRKNCWFKHTKLPTEELHKSVRCYGCNERGHIRPNCPKSQRNKPPGDDKVDHARTAWDGCFQVRVIDEPKPLEWNQIDTATLLRLYPVDSDSDADVDEPANEPPVLTRLHKDGASVISSGSDMPQLEEPKEPQHIRQPLTRVLDQSDRLQLHAVNVSSCYLQIPFEDEDTAALSTSIDHKQSCMLVTGKEKTTGRGSTDWIVDSGASRHFCRDRQSMRKVRTCTPTTIQVASGNGAVLTEEGEVTIQLRNGRTIVAQEVLLAPSFSSNLLSVAQLSAKGLVTTFDDIGCEISDRKKNIASGTLRNRQYVLDTLSAEAAYNVSLSVWHQRLGHIHPGYVARLRDCSMVSGMKSAEGKTLDGVCEACTLGKIARKKFPKTRSTERAKLANELSHTDLIIIGVETPGGNVHLAHYVDDMSGYIHGYPISRKSEVIEVHKVHSRRTLAEVGRTIGILRTDNAKEYTSKAFEQLLTSHGTQHQLSTPYSPQQNGVAERSGRTIIEMTRTMLVNAPEQAVGRGSIDCNPYPEPMP